MGRSGGAIASRPEGLWLRLQQESLRPLLSGSTAGVGEGRQGEDSPGGRRLRGKIKLAERIGKNIPGRGSSKQPWG